MKEIIIRNGITPDLSDIVDIYNSNIPGRMVTADLNPVSVKSREKWFNEHNPARRPIWVAQKDNEICGWLSFQSFYGRPAYNSTAELSIYIANAYQKKGLGSKMLQMAIDACPNLGIKTLLGFIFAHNYPSLRLVRSFDFKEWGKLLGVAELDDIDRDLIIVGKKLAKRTLN